MKIAGDAHLTALNEMRLVYPGRQFYAGQDDDFIYIQVEPPAAFLIAVDEENKELMGSHLETFQKEMERLANFIDKALVREYRIETEFSEKDQAFVCFMRVN